MLGRLQVEPSSPSGTTLASVRGITDSDPLPTYPEYMSHAYAHNLMHCVFSTKERMPLIRDPESLWRYTVGLAYQKGVHVVAAGGTSNHAHRSFSQENA